MTLKEIEDALPNGFHDARIHMINIDYVKGLLMLEMEVWVAEAKEANPDIYRVARLTLSPFQFCVIEPPDPTYLLPEGKALWVDAGSADSALAPPSIPSHDHLPKGAFTYCFFVHDWNAFIYIAALDARLEFL